MGAETFFQCNRFLPDVFVKEILGGESGEAAVDLYAGVGLFSAFLSDTFKNVIAVEENRNANKYFFKNHTRTNIRFYNQSVERWLQNSEASFAKPDLLIADPPRMGLSKKARQGILALSPARLVYVSCNPATLARDLHFFIQNHYQINSITLVDMFPQTFHIETIVKLSS
jgi:23S rRNA (uracil1939-C5)-methyltransferase